MMKRLRDWHKNFFKTCRKTIDKIYFEKIKIKGLQIIENGVKIEVNGQVCTARGSLLVEEEAVRTQKPVIEIQEENDQHLEEEREQT